jgi:hypothetical protein
MSRSNGSDLSEQRPGLIPLWSHELQQQLCKLLSSSRLALTAEEVRHEESRFSENCIHIGTAKSLTNTHVSIEQTQCRPVTQVTPGSLLHTYMHTYIHDIQTNIKAYMYTYFTAALLSV